MRDRQKLIVLLVLLASNTGVGFTVIITGLLFSLFTKWGFFDFY